MSKVGDVANKVGSNIVKTVTKLADVFVENVVSKVAATANGFTTSARSIGTTVLNNDSAQYSILAQLSAYAVQNLTRQSENLVRVRRLSWIKLQPSCETRQAIYKMLLS